VGGKIQKPKREKMIAISNRSIEELEKCIQELENLTSKPSLSSRDEKRHSFLLAKVSLLKSGVGAGELRRYERERLLAEAGLPRLPERARTRLDEETEQEWRKFASGEPVRETFRPPDREVRANLAGTETVTWTQGQPGGYFVPEGMHTRAFEAMKMYDAIFDDEFSNIVETETGANMPFPAWDDVANASVQVGETSQSNEVDIANFGSSQLNAYSFRSKIVGVSLEMLQDSNFPIGGVLERVFAMRHARGVGAALVTGSGVGAPTGLITATIASGASPVVAAGSSANTGGSETGANSVGTADIGKLYAKLDPAYRPGACWYMHDATLQYLAQLIDKNGRPIVDFGIGPVRGGDGPSIWGHNVAICPSMPQMGSAKNTVFFGNPQYFVQRRVPSSMYVRRFWQNPSLVQFGLVGFESWLRCDSNLVAPNPNFVAYQFIQQHS
jgi:HK97 family phage major capsid protein